MHQLTLRINGQVQGVGFRWAIRDEATRLGLVGSVKNNYDGTVSVVAQGDESELKKLREFCRSGYRWASVTEIQETWGGITKKGFVDFSIRYL